MKPKTIEIINPTRPNKNIPKAVTLATLENSDDVGLRDI